MKKVLSSILVLALMLIVSASAQPLQDGDVAPDFTFKLSDGREMQLSEILKEKELVILNLWASWCDPCQREFPALQEAYSASSDRIEVIALSVENKDTNEVIEAFRQSMGLSTLPLGRAEGVNTYFSLIGVPTSVFINRDGVIVKQHPGSITTPDIWQSLIDLYTGEDYDPSKPQSLYVFGIVDENNEPVPGCMMQFCTDKTCELRETNEYGNAILIGEPYPYEVHMLSAPEGYAPISGGLVCDVGGVILTGRVQSE